MRDQVARGTTPTFHTIALRDTVWARWRNAWRPAIVVAYTRKYVQVDLTVGKRRQASKIAWENIAWRREDVAGADNPAQMELLS